MLHYIIFNVFHFLLLLALGLVDRLLGPIALILQPRTDVLNDLPDLEWQFDLLRPFIFDRVESILHHMLISLAD